MSTMQAALRTAGLSTAPFTPDVQPNFEHLARKPGEIIKRDLLWAGGTVKVKIPADARIMSADTPTGQVKYLQFPRLVKFVQGEAKAGLVNMHVHAENLQDLAGKTIVASAEVWRKDFDGGRSFIYVDFKPAKTGTKPSHRLSVMDSIPHVTVWPKHVTTFQTPHPLLGAVVIVKGDQPFC